MVVTKMLMLAALGAGPNDPSSPASADDVILGEGDHRYRWVKNWAKLPEGVGFGNTHGCMVVDHADRIYVNTDSKNAVMVFENDGRYVMGWGEQFAGGFHGMTITTEGNNQFLYITHLGRHELVKTTLDGKVLWAIGYPQESGVYENSGQYRPTGVAVAPSGDIYVVDGYGTNWIHQFDWKGSYIRSFGGPGTEPGKCKTCHGIWVDTRGETPLLLVADRENNRMQRFGLDGSHIDVVHGFFRRPCSFYEHDGVVVAADLAGRVTLLNEKNELIGHLGDQPDPNKRAKNGIPVEEWKDGEFLSPHGACFDSKGNLYVQDWNRHGRVTKLERLR